jgi:hypothetical protein
MTTENENIVSISLNALVRILMSISLLLRNDLAWYSRFSAPVLVFQSRAVPSLLAVGKPIYVFLQCYHKQNKNIPNLSGSV